MSTDLAVRPTELPKRDDFALMKRNAELLVKSGLMPDGVKTPEAAFLIIQKGFELGIPAVAAINGIHVIKGKPTVSAELMLALIYREHGDNAFIWLETSNVCAKAKYKRRNQREYSVHAFTLDDAKQAQLAGGGNWSKFPGAMLRSRCISAIARMAFPDCIGGFYTTEELDPHAEVDDNGVYTITEVQDAGVGSSNGVGTSINSSLAPASPSPTVVEHITRDGTKVDLATGVVLEDAPPDAQSMKKRGQIAVNTWLDLTGRVLTDRSAIPDLGKAAGVSNPKKWTDEDILAVEAYVATLAQVAPADDAPLDDTPDAEVVDTDDAFAF